MRQLCSVALFATISLVPIPAPAQDITGRVVDVASNDPLPFVNVYYESRAAGTTTDVQGRFSIRHERGGRIVFSIVGYHSLILDADSLLLLDDRLVYLREQPTNLEEVVVQPNDSAVLAIVRRTVAFRKQNDPGGLDSYSFNAYSKLYSTLEGFDTDSIARNDSSRLASHLRQHHLFLQETYTERSFLKPNHHSEQVLANRFSGIKNPLFALSVADYNSISIYRNYINILGVDYLTPVADNSWNSYEFILEGETIRATDTLYTIFYRPRRSLRLPALQGTINITSNRYAVENITAKSTDDGSMIVFALYQGYRQMELSSFPQQLSATLTLNQFDVSNKKLKFVYRGYLENIIENPSLAKKDFGPVTLSFDPLANSRDDEYWREKQAEEMSSKDKNTFLFYDTSAIAKRMNIDKLARLAQYSSLGFISTRYLDIHWPEFLSYNEYEGVRLGIGLSTNAGISKLFQVEGYAGYGFRDEALKYGYGIKFLTGRSRTSFVRAFANNDVHEAAASNDSYQKVNVVADYSGIRKYTVFRMDRVRTVGLEFDFSLARSIWTRASVTNRLIDPVYNYLYRDRDKFTITEASVGLYYGPGQKIVQVGTGNVISPPGRFNLGFLATKGIPDIFGGDYAYWKFEVDINGGYRLRKLGEFRYNLISGMIAGHTPYPVMFNGKGFESPSELRFLYLKNNFQLMGMTEFLSSAYISVFTRHNFGPIFGTRSRFFRPDVSITQAVGYGKVSNADSHQGIDFKTMDRGYFESGIIIDNIARLNYQDIFWVGLGAGGFMRYGDYRFRQAIDNTALKLSLKISY